MRFNKNLFVFLGIFTLVGFSLIGGLIVIYIIKQPFASIFSHGFHWLYQLAIGLVYGLITAFLGWQIIKSKLLTDTKSFYTKLIEDLDLNIWDILFISACAGIGEEILFRAAVQYYLGIWITAVIFVAMHGYLNPKNWKLSIYGGFMTLVIVGIGYMFEYIGMISAMAAHFAIDVYLLTAMNKQAKSMRKPD
ncbi:MAG: CPBP family intramembrane metalloprotease [Flavobacteriales bacterium]|nr:CPBP family intramembrane metalloprotease [Flavobacteriales bacterium]